MHGNFYYNHVTGTTDFIDDIPVFKNTMFAKLFTSTIAYGKIVNLSFEKALLSPGIIAILDYRDIPGDNKIGGIVDDEPLLASDEVSYYGQGIALIIGKTEEEVLLAYDLISVKYEEYCPVLEPEEAFRNDNFISEPVEWESGNFQEKYSLAFHKIEGEFSSGAQEHVYLETQGSIAYLKNSKVFIRSSTQGPTAVQKTVSRVLGLPMNHIEVEVGSLGGGFGGKEDQATIWACLCAWAAWYCKQPVKMVLGRGEDMRLTGKRHPYVSRYKLGLDKRGHILAYEVRFFQNSGAFADLSTSVLQRSMLHATGAYKIDNVRVWGACCRTNLPPFTAFRGFGAPQAMLVIEAAIKKAAILTGIDYYKLQTLNLIKQGDCFFYGQKKDSDGLESSWAECYDIHNIPKIKKEVEEFNDNSVRFKKAWSCFPMCFGVAFTNKSMNQANALVKVYYDGTVGISTAAVEMGQGVNLKLAEIAASIFTISSKNIIVTETNTDKNANTSPSAASSTADLNGGAVMKACKNIVCRLLGFLKTRYSGDWRLVDGEFVGGLTSFSWAEIIKKAYVNRVSLSEQSHYYTKNLNFDGVKGDPFSYFSCGSALSVVCLDKLIGKWNVEKLAVVHDGGDGVCKEVDCGQIEGAWLQGLGWLTMENVNYDSSGKLINSSLASYKIPTFFNCADDFDIKFLESKSSNGVNRMISKAVGEPPFMYAIGTYIAISEAINRFKKDASYPVKSPLGNEDIIMGIYC